MEPRRKPRRVLVASVVLNLALVAVAATVTP
jgi:hypothetical protein